MVRLVMSLHPRGGISWGLSAWRPRPLPATAPGSVSWPAEGPPPGGAPPPPPAPPPAGGALAVPGAAAGGGLAPDEHGRGQHAGPYGRPGHPPGHPRALAPLPRRLGHRRSPLMICVSRWVTLPSGRRTNPSDAGGGHPT